MGVDMATVWEFEWVGLEGVLRVCHTGLSLGASPPAAEGRRPTDHNKDCL